MLKKIVYITLIALSLILVSTFCFANDNLKDMTSEATNTARNIVGGAENAVEGAANGVGNMVNSGTNAVENAGNTISEGAKNMTSSISNTKNETYTASRTSTGESTFMGMGSTAWTWLILGIAAIAIVALVWYYSMQFTNNKNNNKYE